MQVQRIRNHNQNFTALRINRPKIDWNSDVLLNFVKNTEVQKFVAEMDYLNRDVFVSCLNGQKIAIEILKKNDVSSFGIPLSQFKISEIEQFSSCKFYQKFEKQLKTIVSDKPDTVITNDKKIYSAREGYNRIASHYDDWKWQNFWEQNELPIIEKWGKNKKKLYGADFGVGSGRNLKMFLTNNNKVDGFDISGEMIKICRQKYSNDVKKGMLSCYNLNIFDINTSLHKYDWIIANRVISNIEDVEKFIQTLQKYIKNGGECFISDVHPDRNYDYTHINIADNDIYIETYKHSIQQITQLFKKYNFEIVKYEEFSRDNLKLIDTIKTDTKPIFYYFILKYKG